MKQFFHPLLAFSLLAICFSSCGSSETGELLGVSDRPDWKGISPYGMVYVPSGTAHVGNSDQDITGTYIQRPKRITINGFYMDDTEISNNEYRQFIHWIRDSIAHDMLGDFDENGSIDWELEIDYEDEALADLYLEETFAGRRQANVNLYEYSYNDVDWKAASRARPDGNSGRGMSGYTNTTAVNIYPDTLVWVRDFSYSYNEPMARSYFSHPAYDNYPIVGIDWGMARAFSHWRTSLWNKYNDALTEDFRLPTEYEFEYAARGGREHAAYPWGGPYVRNSKGCLLANFKPGRGNYPDDGGAYTVPVDAYYPNDFGLYNMSGNVAEWTVSAFFENANSFVHDFNPTVTYNALEDDPKGMKRKVIRGGSWKDISFYLQCGTRDFEYQDTTKSYVGFRNVLSFTGRSINDF
ncbi:T9SS ring complex lipoprotein PorK/GldK [Neolewinella antarctica]|uniref:Gliding motility-associated lipoprotein GldK n=1 Tax=Neolewinella antarctica TaxID=442734 RepID=A0ABX0XBX1_9BACT|nr:SUMF1/EgtB/PvdO family nonheme iron enzyme [Neolewinella antarctica]NJC26449.1 gliding motility-associated lipoprotein GldK [Neolewinella antarctica]